jgi:hypothetical protein
MFNKFRQYAIADFLTTANPRFTPSERAPDCRFTGFLSS